MLAPIWCGDNIPSSGSLGLDGDGSDIVSYQGHSYWPIKVILNFAKLQNTAFYLTYVYNCIEGIFLCIGYTTRVVYLTYTTVATHWDVDNNTNWHKQLDLS